MIDTPMIIENDEFARFRISPDVSKVNILSSGNVQKFTVEVYVQRGYRDGAKKPFTISDSMYLEDTKELFVASDITGTNNSIVRTVGPGSIVIRLKKGLNVSGDMAPFGRFAVSFCE